MNTEDADMDLMITTFNNEMTEIAGVILDKHPQKKNLCVTAEILRLCDKRTELRKKRFELVGSEKHKEVNNTKRCLKKVKENWI